MMNHIIFILLFSLATILPGNADDILSKKVPWSGQTNRATLGELIARASGWAEGANHGELKLTKRLALQDRNKELEKFTFRDDKKSTYGDFLKEAFRMAGLNVVLESSHPTLEYLPGHRGEMEAEGPLGFR